MHVHLTDSNADVLHTSIPINLIESYKNCTNENETIIENGTKYRQGKLFKTEHGCAYLITDDPRIVKRPRLFKEKLSVYFDFISDISQIKEQAYKKANTHTRRLVHNLDSLSGHNIQEIYNLIPESELRIRQNKDRKDYIRSEVKNRINNIDTTILNLIKNNEAMKMEFSVFNRLTEGVNQSTEKQKHKIYQAFMSVAHTFFQDFADKDIFLRVTDSNLRVMMDYELFQVAIYQILDNAVKYARKSSNIDVVFSEENEVVYIEIHMSSLKIEPEEIDKITEDGFCGAHAKQSGKSGKGIGMFMVRKAINLNGGDIEVKANVSGETPITLNTKEYCENIFKISLERA